jgi:signal transduction histidine kinase/phage shock protein PspC (stress-responsive transcriptional regulator)
MPAMAQVELQPGARDLAGRPRPRLERSRSNRVVAGVAAGIGKHLGIDPLLVRIGFVVLSFALGFGIVVYVLTWLLAPQEAAERAHRPSGRLIPPTRTQAVGTALVMLGVVVLLWFGGLVLGGALAWPVALAGVGFAILWARDSDEEGRRRVLSGLGSPLEAVMSGRISLTRIAIGSLLILAAMAVFLAANTSLSAVGNMLLAVMAAIAGLGLIAGPWAWRMAQALVEERSSRIRSEARAEMAAHLHDSVLQTLALIQRARAPREMVSLARTQERELRAWLYRRAPSVSDARLRDAIDAMAGRIERHHQVGVEAVVVGDAALDDHVRALVAACGEATLNAARHSGSTEVSVYVEVEDDAISAFVRDHGAGFDLAAVSGDRRGIADSIVGRLERHGGSAQLHSRAGAGTEVVLRLPVRPA